MGTGPAGFAGAAGLAGAAAAGAVGAAGFGVAEAGSAGFAAGADVVGVDSTGFVGLGCTEPGGCSGELDWVGIAGFSAVGLLSPSGGGGVGVLVSSAIFIVRSCVEAAVKRLKTIPSNSLPIVCQRSMSHEFRVRTGVPSDSSQSDRECVARLPSDVRDL